MKASREPLPWGLIIFGVGFSYGMGVLLLYFCYLCFRGGDWAWGIVGLLFTVHVVQMLGIKSWTNDVRIRFVYRHQIRLTRAFKQLFNQIPIESTYQAADLTNGLDLTVLRLDKRTILVCDGATGFIVFNRRLCAHQCEEFDDILINDYPATVQELQRLLRRILTYAPLYPAP